MKNNHKKGIPTLKESKILLDEAGKLNPGPWVKHSINVGNAAQIIAENSPGLCGEVALILGMLHDIGRRAGITGLRHILDGYRFAKEKGFYNVAKVCITHSFDCKDIRSAIGTWDCTKKEYDFIKQYLENIEYDDYDKLIQLCDSLALPNGFCLIEKRMVDVALRHGINEYTTLKWKATFEIKDYFENKTGKSIYSILPGVVENTFSL
jgi:hypothetical protein